MIDNSFYLQFKSFYDIMAIVLSILIVFHFSLSVYYGIKMIILKSKNRFGWCPEMLVTYESILWVILFLYIGISSLLGKSIIVNTSFGAIFIRPVILITSVITAITQRRRYLKASQKYILKDFLLKE